MAEINRHFEYVDKEDILKKIVSLEFGRFLKYYANAPEIVKPTSERSKRKEERGSKGAGRKGAGGRGTRRTEQGYRRLFINLGKADGFYPGEVMQFVNKHVHGRQEIGHIDLLSKFSYIEVPEQDAEKVMRALNGTSYKGRDVRCNDADDNNNAKRGGQRNGRKGDAENSFTRYEKKGKQRRTVAQKEPPRKESGRKDDWRQFFEHPDIQLIGEEPDFSEEGWARRRPKKKK